MNWNKVVIRKLCLPTRQRDPRDMPSEEFSYVDISSIDRDSKMISQISRILGSEAPSRARKEIKAGDILISSVRPNLNAVATVPPELNGQIASTGFCVLRPDSERVIGKYLFYYSRTPEFIKALCAKVRGAHYPAVSDKDVTDVKIPLPPISEQCRIVEILDQADVLRKKRAEADTTATRILPALFYKMFGDPATNHKGFKKRKLGDLIKVKSGNFLPAKEMDTEGKYPVYGGNGINGYHSNFMFKHPVIVLGRVGVYCGVVYYSEPFCWITDNALYISECSDSLHPRYLVEALRIANLNQYAGRAGQPLISGTRIYPVEILVPPIDDQKRFADSVEGLAQDEMKRKVSGSHIDNLFSILLHRAFTGDLTTKWREANRRKLLQEMEQQAKALNLGA